MTLWIRVERSVAYGLYMVLACGSVGLVLYSLGGGSLWWLILAAAAGWLAFQILDSLVMTMPAKEPRMRRWLASKLRGVANRLDPWRPCTEWFGTVEPHVMPEMVHRLQQQQRRHPIQGTQ